MSDRAIRSVAVFGGGITALSAALAFGRALPQVQVTLIATPPDPAALADRMPGTLPSIARFHDAIGVSEPDVIRNGAAAWRLGTRFEDWSADGEPWIHAFGDYGLPAGIVPFHQLWVQARRLGRALPFHAYSAGAVLAGAGKFVHPEQDAQSVLSTYDYGLRLDPERYAALLGALADQRRIPRFDGVIGGVERRTDGGVAAVMLDDGRRIGADLFIDSTGPSAGLLPEGEGGFEDWSAFLPCDRLVIGTAGTAEPGSCDSVRGEAGGWTWHAPLPDRTFTCAGYSSRDGARQGESVVLRPGRLRAPWRHNVLAIGDGAVALDPLVCANLHLAHSAILRALDHLPDRDCNPLELSEYNRRTGLEADRVRDFLALHYLRSGNAGLFWEACRPMSETLARTVQQFERRGRLPFHEEETFAKESWLAVLLGMGVLPLHLDPVAMSAPLETNLDTLNAFAADLAGLPARLPAYGDYLNRARQSA